MNARAFDANQDAPIDSRPVRPRLAAVGARQVGALGFAQLEQRRRLDGGRPVELGRVGGDAALRVKRVERLLDRVPHHVDPQLPLLLRLGLQHQPTLPARACGRGRRALSLAPERAAPPRRRKGQGRGMHASHAQSQSRGAGQGTLAGFRLPGPHGGAESGEAGKGGRGAHGLTTSKQKRRPDSALSRSWTVQRSKLTRCVRLSAARLASGRWCEDDE